MCRSNSPLPLRPHHGMCLAYYVGRGYSAEFTRRMEEIDALLRRDPPIRLAAQPDAICASCPNRLENRCRSAERVERFDRAVLARCGLHAGAVLPFSQFTALVEQRILAPGRRAEICGDCQWNDLCRTVRDRWQAEGSPYFMKKG